MAPGIQSLVHEVLRNPSPNPTGQGAEEAVLRGRGLPSSVGRDEVVINGACVSLLAVVNSPAPLPLTTAAPSYAATRISRIALALL